MPKLPGYCIQLLDEVEKETSYSLILTPERLPGFRSRLDIGTRKRPIHELKYHPNAVEHRAHLAVQASYRILRLWEAPAGERYVGVRRMPKLSREEDAHLEKTLGPMLPSQRIALSRRLALGMTHLLLATPSDIRIERAIYEELPEHRGRQAYYLETLIGDAPDAFKPSVLAKAPPLAKRNTTAMNAVAIQQYALLIGMTPDPILEEQSPRRLVDRLTEHLNAARAPGAIGDHEVTDAWCSEFGLRGWYEWVLHDAP